MRWFPREYRNESTNRPQEFLSTETTVLLTARAPTSLTAKTTGVYGAFRTLSGIRKLDTPIKNRDMKSQPGHVMDNLIHIPSSN